ncbi:MAG: UbiD family decarboxylase [Xanthobacteraceae bacterium]
MLAPDCEKFRLRRFVERLVQQGECVVHDAPIDLIDIAAVLDGNPKAVWFRAVGPERTELVGNVMGAKRRVAMALDTDAAGFVPRMRGRLARPIAPVEVTSSAAPVHEVVLTGDEADFRKLPVHLQHGLDAAPYISASMDFARDPATGWTNIGCRRMMLRGARTAGIDLIAPSDLKAIYLKVAPTGQKLPVAFVVGGHPTNFLAGVALARPMDELHVLGAMRGEAVPIVKCRTIDVFVPADAEYVLEGYLDPRGHVESEGPYGEYCGYYGVVKRNPLFHLTAITHRRDALFQTVTISGRNLASTDTAQLNAARAETAIWNVLEQAIREPIAVHVTGASGGMSNVRVSMRQRNPGETHNAIAAVFASMADVKHVFIYDEDIDIFSDEQVDWAFATRFQADRDLIVGSGYRVVPIDPSLQGSRIGAKLGFDCTKPFGKGEAFEWTAAAPPAGLPQRELRSVEETLTAGPASYIELMAALRTRDGREVLTDLERLYAEGRLARQDDGRYRLDGSKG